MAWFLTHVSEAELAAIKAALACINAELAYSWRDFGSTKPRKNEDNEDITKKHLYRAHNLSLGFRIDI